MTFLRRSALLAGVAFAGVAFADEPKTLPAIKVIPAEKKADPKSDEEK